MPLIARKEKSVRVMRSFRIFRAGQLAKIMCEISSLPNATPNNGDAIRHADVANLGKNRLAQSRHALDNRIKVCMYLYVS